VPLSRNLGTLTSWNLLGHSGPVTGLLYLLIARYIQTAASCMLLSANLSVSIGPHWNGIHENDVNLIL